MQVIRGIDNISLTDNLSVALGNFDGVHLGHQEIIKTAVNYDAKSAVVTFYPHPSAVLGKGEHRYLQSLEDRLKGFEKLGVDFTIAIDFNPEFAKMSAQDFISEILVKKLHVKNVVSGYDFKFGNNREGDFTLLENFSKKLNFNYTKVNRLTFDGMQISTSAIKKLLSQGRIITANSMLGKEITVSGKALKVVHEADNKKVTAFQLSVDNSYLLPMNGAYTFRYQKEYGVIKIGHTPEVIFMNQEVDISNQTLTFALLTLQRPERIYEGDKQLLSDISQASYTLRNLNQHFRKVG